jgi:hypothetical protein
VARIAIDLGDDELACVGGRAGWWRPSLRRKKPDFFAVFAAVGVSQLETYLANWAAYYDHLARRESERASSE